MPDYDYDELFPNRFIKAGLLQGKAVTLTIADVQIESMPDKKGKNGQKNKGILSFRERDLELVLNKTNAECLKGMFGRRTGGWVGKRITIYPRMVDAFGRQKLAIRILGSPDIAQEMRIELSLGQERTRAVMKRTTAKTQPAPTVEQDEPGTDFDPETGEVHAENGSAGSSN